MIPSGATQADVTPRKGARARLVVWAVISDGAGTYTIASAGGYTFAEAGAPGAPIASLVSDGAGGYVITVGDFSGTGIVLAATSGSVFIL